MSGKKDDFWKELMGEDFQVDEPIFPQPGSSTQPGMPTQPGAPARHEPDPGESGVSPGFTIEYVSRDGKPVSPAPPQPSRPAQAQPSTPAQPQPSRPAQSQPPKPAQGQSPAVAPQQGPGQGRGPVSPPSGDLFDEMSRNMGASEQAGPPETPRPSEPVYVPSGDVLPTPPSPRSKGPESPETPGERPVPRRRQKKSKEDKFEVEFDFDAEYPDVNEKAIRRGRTKRTGCLSGILLFLFVICVSVVLACVGWMWATDVLGFDGRDQAVEVTLPKSIFHEEAVEEEDEDGNTVTVRKTVADIDAVADELYDQGLIKYKWLFKIFSQFSHADTKVQAGTWTLNLNYDYRAIVHGMTARTGKRETITLTIPEGYTITQIVAMMEENGVCDREELLDSLANTDFDYDFLKDDDVPALGNPKRLEGYLFPDTYEFYKDDDPDSVIKRFLSNFRRKWTEEFDTMAAELGYSRQQILTVAAMIEKEAGVDSERDTIASVIYNRLNHPDRQGTNGLLQIDATINYIIADTGEEYSTEIDSPYNTYLYPGLPAGPIANPGVASIRAALNPASSDYYYYALGLNKSHRFFTNYNDFVAFVNSDQYGG